MSSTFDDLLEVQAHDTRLDQLRHQLDHLPERAARDAAITALAETDAAAAEQQEVRDGLGRQQKRLDDEIETVGDKRRHVEETLYSGSVTNARELQDLQEESEALGRRISQLEDQDLEIMVELEPVDARLAELAQERTDRATALEAAEIALTAASAELASAIDAEEGSRAAVAERVDPSLLAEYQKLRAANGGVGVARLTGSQCGGCHLTLSAVEVAAIRKRPDEIAHCEECGRLLVP